MLLRAPASWPQPVVAAVAMVLLAALDLGGSFAAKEAIGRRSILLAAFGAGLFLAVFWVYISSLEVAELSSVTFGWIVILQVGVVLLDRFRYHVVPARGAWLAIGILLAAQAYLVLAPSMRPQPPRAESSVEGDQKAVQAVDDELGELGDGECAGPQSGDQQCVPHRVTSGVGHVPPQRSDQRDDLLTTKK